jgi:hypothetical protein
MPRIVGAPESLTVDTRLFAGTRSSLSRRFNSRSPFSATLVVIFRCVPTALHKGRAMCDLI